MQRRLDEIDNEFERAVFMAVYRSRRQRMLRMSAVLLITAKHGLRGLLYVWPLVLLVFISLPGYWNWLRLGLLVLAVGAWFRYIYGAVRDDYRRFVANCIIRAGGLCAML
jgi:hypothetical protein